VGNIINKKKGGFGCLFCLIIMFSISIPQSMALSVDIPVPIDYSTVDTNNSQYLQGYTPTTLPTSSATQSAIDGKVSKSGDTMSGDLDMDDNDINNINTLDTYEINPIGNHNLTFGSVSHVGAFPLYNPYYKFCGFGVTDARCGEL